MPGVKFTIFFVLALAGRAFAHNPDTSYCRVAITASQVECKFTYDLATLQRITVLDADGDGRLSRKELESAFPAITRFLREHIYFDLNQREAELGEVDQPSWPEDANAGIPKSDFGQRLVTITFHNPTLNLAEDVTLTFDFFEQLGAAHTVLGAF